MYDTEYDIIKIIEDKMNEGYKVAIYGAGKNCSNVIGKIKELSDDIKIDFIIDKNEKKVGSEINDIKIINPDTFFELDEDYLVIYSLIQLNYFEEVEKMLNTRKSNTITISYIKSIQYEMSIKRKYDKELDEIYHKMYFDGKIFENTKNVQHFYINGDIKMSDISTDTLTIKNGERVVVGSEFEICEKTKKITLFGDSRFFNGCYDKYTIPSFLQKQLGNKYCTKSITLFAMQFYEVLRKIKKMSFAKGDVVVLSNLMYFSKSEKVFENLNQRQIALNYMNEVLSIKQYFDNLGVKMIFVWLPNIKEISSHGKYEKEILKVIENLDKFEYQKIDETRIFPNVEFVKEICNAQSITFCNLIDTFNCKDDDIYIDDIHFGDKANELVAKHISKVIELVDYNFDTRDEIWNEDIIQYTKQVRMKKCFNDDEVFNYLKNLEILRNDNLNNVGAIVMNANPFTKGHQYLVETAAAQVEHLYVFVVEEDKSYFKFKDRLELVKLGTQHIDNVTVLPSGKGIISSVTMPEYFTKESETTQILDASTDIDVFGLLIAPILKISKRFVGDEPFCNTTRQYNEQMKERLSEYNIELVILDRVGTGGNCTSSVENEIISATKVRAYLKNKDFESLEKFVPSTTLKFLTNFEI